MTLVAPAKAPAAIDDLDTSTIRAFLRGAISADALPEPAWGPIGREVFERTYSRDLPDGRKETWADTCRRVVNGSLSYLERSLWLPDEDVELFRLLYSFAAVPAGRHLWVTGTSSSYMSHNCWASGFGARPSDHYRYLAARLFEGGGVGANYSADLMAHLPPVRGEIVLSFACRLDHVDADAVRQAAGEAFVTASAGQDVTLIAVEDTREGWVDAWAQVIDLAHRPGRHEVLLDVSAVRPYGAPLRTFGGRASGPAPLVASMRAIVGILATARANRDGTGRPRRLSGLETMQIDHEIAAAVVSGGARRSARMSMMHWRDPDIFSFIACKADQMQHWSTNVSVEIDGDFAAAVEAGDPHATRVLREVAEGMALNGEPGLVNTGAHSLDEYADVRITNPCVTGDTWVQTSYGLRRVSDLVAHGAVELVVNDEHWETTGEGFFKTGTKPVVKVDIDGTPLRMTTDHLVSTPDGWRPAGDLRPGDVVDLTDSLHSSWSGEGTEVEGYLLGHLVGDGTFDTPNENGAPGAAILYSWTTKDGAESVEALILGAIADARLKHRSDWAGWTQVGDRRSIHSAPLRDLAARFGIMRGNKTVTDQVMSGSSSLVVGFLRGLFDTDGHVEGASRRGGVSIRLAQSDREMLGRVRTLLLALGIRSVVRNGRPGGPRSMPGGTYVTKETYVLIISGAHAERFSKVIGFTNAAKAEKLDGALSQMTRGFYRKPMTGTVVSVVDDGIEDVFDCQVPGLNAFVANGTIVHNCGEVSLQFDPEDAAGESCNLGSVDLAHFGADDAGAKRAFELMARFLYRSTLNPHRDEPARRIESQNRRLGVGLMGLQGWCAAHGVALSGLVDAPELHRKLEAFRRAARRAADDLAQSLGTPRSVKVTAVAPTGTIAQLSGTTPGIHPVMARYFIRRVRYADSDPQLQELAATGHRIVEDIYAANTSVVEFPVRDQILDRYPAELIEQSDELSAAQFFDLIATVQRHYCAPGDGNAISATAQIAPDTDPDELIAAMRPHLGALKGLTVFPKVSRELSPYEPLTEDEYLTLVADGGPALVGDSNDGECLGGACPIR